MTDMIARDLQEMGEHPVRSFVSLVLSLIITLICLFGCPAAVIVLIFQIGN
jgi:hypothetical protein